MTLEALERPQSHVKPKLHEPKLHEPKLHECATCDHKDRVYLSAPSGTQTAAVWRCGLLSQKTGDEVLVQPHENCFEHRSLTDYWEETSLALIR